MSCSSGDIGSTAHLVTSLQAPLSPKHLVLDLAVVGGLLKILHLMRIFEKDDDSTALLYFLVYLHRGRGLYIYTLH